MSEILSNTGVKLWSETDYNELWLTIFDQLTGQGGKSNIRLIDEAIGKINAALDGYKFEFSSDEDRLYISKGDSKLPVSLIDSNGHVATKVDGTTITIDESGVIKGVPVDDALSEESTNPLQNKVIAGELKSIKSKMGTDESAIKQNTSDITSNTKRIEANETAISTLNGTGDGSVKKAVSDGIAEVVAGAPEDFDTLKEMSDWISTHETSASAMNSQIQDNKKAITTLQTDKADKTEIPTELPANGGNADTVNGHTVKSDVPENAVFTDTTYSDATQIEHGLMSVDDKKKLDGLTKYTPDGTTITVDEDGTIHGVAKVTVDDALSSTSTNPVQNKVVNSNFIDIRKETTVNLLNPTLQTTTLNGVTCTNNGDGTYTFNGTATSTARFEFGIDDNLIAGKTYKVLGIPIDGSFSTVLMGWDDHGYFNKEGTVDKKTSVPKPISMQVISGYTCDNLVFKPMLTTNLSATYDDFVPYTGDTGKLNGDVAELKAEIVNNKTIVDAAMSDTSTNPVQNKVIKNYIDARKSSIGQNLITYPYEEADKIISNGITWTVNDDGTVTANGTAINTSFFNLTNPIVGSWGTLHAGTYTIMDGVNLPHGGVTLQVESVTGTQYRNTTFTIEQDVVYKIFIQFPAATVANNITFKPMLEIGSIAHEYQPTIISNPTLKNKITDIRSEATVNLLKPTLETSTLIENGVKCTNNGDGTYTLNGTATGSAEFLVQSIGNLLKKHTNETLLLVGCPKGGDYTTYKMHFWSNSAEIGFDTGDGEKVYPKNPSENAFIKIEITDGYTCNNLVFKPMLTTNLNATYDNFVSYTGDTGRLNGDVAGLAKKVPTFEKNDSVFYTYAGHSPVITGDTAGRFSALSDEWSDNKGRVIKLKNDRDAITHITIFAAVPAHGALLLQIYSPDGAPIELTCPLFYYNQNNDSNVESIWCNVTAPVGTEVSIAFNPIVIKNV